MWLPLEEAILLGINPSLYVNVSKVLRVVVAEGDHLGFCILADLKTGQPVLYFDTNEAEQRALLEVCCNLAVVDQDMDVGTISVACLLEILETHREPT